MSDSLHDDLKIAKALVYDSCDLALTDYAGNKESAEYAACTFKLNEYKIIHRVSKITPTKTGQFVTVWKRTPTGITSPYEDSDDINFIVITTRSGEQLGQFIFPKSILIEKGILSTATKFGKRGIRVYPPWDNTTSKQAIQTQAWQTKYFLALENNVTDLVLAKRLFFLEG
jgi:hypothetical protein